MVEEITSTAAAAHNIKDLARPTGVSPRETEEESSTTSRSGQDTVSISREAVKLLAEEARAEAQVEEAMVEALRTEDSEIRIAQKKAEYDRLREIHDEEPARDAQSADNERTRA